MKVIKKHSDGFTLIELIAVMVVLSIVAAIVIVRATPTTSYNVVSEAEILKANIRYAQYRALTDADKNYNVNNATWSIVFSSGSYTLQRTADGETQNYNFPYEGSATHNLPGGVTISSTVSPLIFDVWGSPGTTDTTITITDGSSPQVITVTANTGFIP